MTSQSMPTADEIRSIYDKIGDLSADLLGDNIHLGYWEDADDRSSIQEATDRLTDVLVDKLNLTTGQRVLDVGCGNGRPAARLAKAKGVRVVGITNSQHHFEQATARAVELADRVTFHMADAMNMPFESGSFDAIVAIESISLMPDPARAFREMSRLLRPGGRLGVAGPVLSGPLTGANKSFIDNFCAMLTRPPFATLAMYEQFVREARLSLDELVNVRDHVFKKSFAALLPGSPRESTDAWATLGVPRGEAEAMVKALARFAEIPEAAYALLAAKKPLPA